MAARLGAVSKTFALLMEPLRHINNPKFYTVCFRKTFPQVTNPGGLWDSSEELYHHVGGQPTRSALEWKFPSGARIEFAHMQHDSNRHDWQGSQVPLIEWDELTHFTRKQFFYMFSRNRSTSGVRPYTRATCNPVPPDDPVGGWVHEFVGWYIDEQGWAIPERCGVVRWFVMVNDSLRWGDSREELQAIYPELEPKSFTFIKSSVYDNKILLEGDPGYLANLMALPYVEQQQLLGDVVRGGNWLVKPESGKLFNKAWFDIVDAVPAGGRTVRFWDLAATEKKIAGDDPDFTASVKMTRIDDTFYIVDCTEDRIEPAQTDRMIINTAKQDTLRCVVRWEIEGGASGKRDSRHLAGLLVGFDARGQRPQGDKIMRAKGLSAQAYAGNVKLLRGAWNDRFLNHMHGQPDLAHDDVMDSASGAFNELTKVSRDPRSFQG